LAASLGIATYRIRVVGISEGSVVINSEIVNDNEHSDTSTAAIDDIKRLAEVITTLHESNSLLEGYKVLDLSIEVRAHANGVAS